MFYKNYEAICDLKENIFTIGTELFRGLLLGAKHLDARCFTRPVLSCALISSLKEPCT